MKRAIVSGWPLLLCVSLAMCVPTAIAADGYYRWNDAMGNPHHSDRPPPAGTEYEFVSSGGAKVRFVSKQESSTTAPVTRETNPDIEAKKAIEAHTIKIKKNPEYCERARANISTLESSARIRIKDNDGEYRFLTEEEKTIQKQKAQDLIVVHC